MRARVRYSVPHIRNSNLVYYTEVDTEDLWNFKTFVDLALSYDASGSDAIITAAELNNDGLVLYILGDTNDTIYQFDLCPRYDPSSATAGGSFLLSGHCTAPTAVVFSADGITMYIGCGTGFVYEYTLGTEWDVTTAVYSASYDLSATTTSITDLAISDDTDALFVISSGGLVHRIDTSVVSPYDITAVLDISGDYTGLVAGCFNSDGSVFYVIDSTEKFIAYALTYSYDFSSYNKIYETDVSSIGIATLISGDVGKEGGYIILVDSTGSIIHILGI